MDKIVRALGEYHPLRLASADPPRLVEAAVPVLTRVGGMNEHVDLARASRGLDRDRSR